MRGLTAFVSLSAVLFLLTGCSGTQPEGPRYIVDWDKVERVESDARNKGLHSSDITWFHYPKKRVVGKPESESGK